MKKITLLLLGFMSLSNANVQAQNWVNGGNTLTGNGTIGTNSNHSLLFETYNTERGRITNTGLWGIGTGATLPTAKFQINSISSQDPLKVQVNGNTKLFVHKGGGVSVGANVTPPANGFYVSGLVGIGTITPNSKVHINSIVNQDPLRVMYNGSTKMLVHRSGGVAIGGAVTPPANGMYIAGNVAIGITTPFTSTKLTVRNDDEIGTAIVASGDVYGLKAYGTHDDEIGTGVYGNGGFTGVHGYGEYSGVTGVGDYWAGVYGYSENGDQGGVEGSSDSGNGGYFHSDYGNGLYAATNDHVNAWAGYFQGNVYTTGSYLGSDKIIKKNIQGMGNAMSILNKLKPSHYQFRDDGKYASLKLPTGNHYGLLAQDVEEVLPNLVKETTHEVRGPKSMPKPGPDGKLDIAAIKEARKEPKEKITIKAVNYMEFIPILIKGAQEQQATIEQQNTKINQQQAAIEQQNAKIAELTQLVNKLTNSTGAVNPANSYMSQNLPNPTSKSARINLNIPANVTNASLIIHNMAGQQLKQIPLNNSDFIDIDTSNLSNGTYSYSLYLDGEFKESKKLMVVK